MVLRLALAFVVVLLLLLASAGLASVGLGAGGLLLLEVQRRGLLVDLTAPPLVCHLPRLSVINELED